MLFVENESRGMGIGKKLLNFAIDSLGLRKVDVNEQNTQALGFYEYKGFKIVKFVNILCYYQIFLIFLLNILLLTTTVL